MAVTLPFAALLALPACFAWWAWCRRGNGRWWRLAALLVLIAAATGPELAYGRGGSDVILILDRSASMPDPERQRQEELVRLAADQRRGGDRLAVIAVGARAQIAQGPQATARPRLADAAVPDDGSELGEALETAASLIAPGRSARVVIHSDGEATGSDPRQIAARLVALGAPVDALVVSRMAAADPAILEVEVPIGLRLGESFIGAVRLISDEPVTRRWRVNRAGKVIAEGEVRLEALAPQVVVFADRPSSPGLAVYEVELEGALGFAIPTRVEPAALVARLRRLAGEGLLGRAAQAAGFDPARLTSELESLLGEPQAAAMLVALADPAIRAGARSTLIAALEAKLGSIAANLIADQVEEAVAAAVVTQNDRQPLNNRARAALRIDGGERVLVMSGDGTPGNLAKALTATGLSVVSRAEGPLSLADLAACSVLVLDEVPADRISAPGLQAIARWVEDLGGGLLMTGGRRSFGAGGWRKSPVEDVLPVTLELRDEHRKLSCAIAIPIDVSGSMAATVADGRLKLDLATEGAAAVVELLGPRDQVAVFAVDSAATTIVPLTRVEDKGALSAKIRGIQPGGGGIYVYEALAAAGQALLGATAGTRHIVLFSDAADSEEPGDYRNLIADFRKQGITVSVIGLGSERDCDGRLLIDIAKLGGGRCSFAEAAEDIPRLFAQETVLVARSAWVDQAAPLTAEEALPLTLGQGGPLAGTWPTVGGYNLVYARERADVLALAQGDPVSPAVATWRIGTGRSAVVAVDCDGKDSGDLLSWNGYAPLLGGLVRWCSGGEENTAPGRLTARRAGRSATVRLELDPDQRAHWPTHPGLATVVEGSAGIVAAPPLQPVEDGVWEAVIQLDGDRMVLPAVDCAGTAVRGPALCLPYAPEAEPRFGRPPGREVLAGIARDTGGAVRQDLVDVFANPPSPGEIRPLAPWLVALALLLFLSEIAVRRWRLGWSRRLRPATVAAAPAGPNRPVEPGLQATDAAASPVVPPPEALAEDRGLHEALRRLKNRRK